MSNGCGHAAPGCGLQYNWQADRASRRLHGRLLHFVHNYLYRLIPASPVNGEVIRGRRTEYGVKAWRIMWLDPPKTDTRIRSGRVVQNMAVYRLTFYGQTRLKSRPPHSRSPHSRTGPRAVQSNWKQVVYSQSSRNSGYRCFEPASSPVPCDSCRNSGCRAAPAALPLLSIRDLGHLLARSLGLREDGGHGPAWPYFNRPRLKRSLLATYEFVSECGSSIGARQASSTF
ncbi:hypothetical protein BDW60DRAFT_121625 [Aspergillus nidulans var. acristatus]